MSAKRHRSVRKRTTFLYTFFAGHVTTIPYHKHLTTLGLQSLELRRIHRDCFYLYKMLYNIVDSKFNDIFTFRSDLSLAQMSLRGNCLTFVYLNFIYHVVNIILLFVLFIVGIRYLTLLYNLNRLMSFITTELI